MRDLFYFGLYKHAINKKELLPVYNDLSKKWRDECVMVGMWSCINDI